MHGSVRFQYLFGCKCFRHLCYHSYGVKNVTYIYAKISVYEIKFDSLNTPLIFHQQIMLMNDSGGLRLTTITQILVSLVIVGVNVLYL